MLVNNTRSRRKHRVNADINVTPFVDVMLVLLVVFMVAAPALVSGIQVNLPESNSKNVSDTRDPIVVSINAAGELYLMDSKIDEKKLAIELNTITRGDHKSKILVRGDKNLAYSKVVQVIMAINNAGFNKVVLVTVVQDVK